MVFKKQTSTVHDTTSTTSRQRQRQRITSKDDKDDDEDSSEFEEFSPRCTLNYACEVE